MAVSFLLPVNISSIDSHQRSEYPPFVLCRWFFQWCFVAGVIHLRDIQTTTVPPVLCLIRLSGSVFHQVPCSKRLSGLMRTAIITLSPWCWLMGDFKSTYCPVIQFFAVTACSATFWSFRSGYPIRFWWWINHLTRCAISYLLDTGAGLTTW